MRRVVSGPGSGSIARSDDGVRHGQSQNWKDPQPRRQCDRPVSYHIDRAFAATALVSYSPAAIAGVVGKS